MKDSRLKYSKLSDKKLSDTKLEELEDFLESRHGEKLISTCDVDDLILMFNFMILTESEKIKLIYKIFNPSLDVDKMTYLDTEEIKNKFK